MITLTDEEIGKTVVGSNGEEIGIVASVESDTAHVEPEPGIVDRVKGVLGWESDTEDTVPISTDEISEVTDSEVHIEPHFGESAMDRSSGEAGLDEPEVAGSIDSDSERGGRDEEELSDPMGEIDEGETRDESHESVTLDEMEEEDSSGSGMSRDTDMDETDESMMDEEHSHRSEDEEDESL